MRRLLLLIGIVLAFAALGCGGDDDNGDADTTPAADTQAQTQAETTAAEEEQGCTEVAQPEPKRDGGEKRPSSELSGDVSVVFDTNCGSFTVDVDEEAGGLSAASFVQLARSGFYEDTFFHRIVPSFVIQGGDPTGTGAGGPGYTTEDPPPSDATYSRGTVAMAKAGPEPPGSAGSQFFIVTGEDAGLPPDYAIVGEVTEGMDVVEAIGELGDATEQPTRIVKIERARVRGG